MTALRGVLGTLVIIVLLASVACASTSAPSPVASSAAPAASPASKPAESSGAASNAAASAAATAEWDKVLAAAKKEGKIVLAGARGDTFRNAAMEFQKAYPEIKIEYTGFQGSSFGPKILAEREAGQYLWDVHIGGSGTLISQLKEKNALDPLKPALMLPDVLDDKAWIGGLDGGFLDKEGQYVYAFLGYLYYGAHVNRALAPESQLSQFDQLLDPRWKGKIAMLDPRKGGASAVYSSYLIIMKGEEYLRKILNQDVLVQEDGRLLLEGLIRGRYPIAMGVSQSDFQEFKAQGATGDIKPLDPGNIVATQLASGSGNIALINRAPNLNAAKVFANWVLSKEGMAAHAKHVNQSTRRVDISQPTEDAPNPKVNYIWPNHQKYEVQRDRGLEIAKEIIK